MSYEIEHTRKCIKDNKAAIEFCESRMHEEEDVVGLKQLIEELKDRGNRLESRLSELLEGLPGTLDYSTDTKKSPLI